MLKYEDRDFEFRVRDLAAADRTLSDLPQAQQGVLVEAVREGGWAALSHLADGDIILAIDGDPVVDVAAVQRKMERVARDKPSAVVMKVRRDEPSGRATADDGELAQLGEGLGTGHLAASLPERGWPPTLG